MDYLKQIFQKWLSEAGLSEYQTEVVSVYLLFAVVILAAIVLYFVTKRILLRVVHQLAKKSKTDWDDKLIENKFFSYLSYLAPALFIYVFTPTVLEQFPKAIAFFLTALEIYLIIIILLVINSFLNAIGAIYQDFKIARTKSIKGYIQIVKVIAIFIAIIIIFASLLDQSPWGLLGGLGAFTAVLLLIFDLGLFLLLHY